MKIILDNIFNEIIVVDNENIIVFINEAASILFDLDFKSDIGKDINKLIPDSKLSYFLASKKEENNKTIVVKELSLILNVIPLSSHENIEGSILIFSNVTNYNKLLHKLDKERNSSEILNTVIETAYDGLVIIDNMGIITMMSKAILIFYE